MPDNVRPEVDADRRKETGLLEVIRRKKGDRAVQQEDLDQQDRSQLGNRELAMQMLKSRLYEIELQKRNEIKDAANSKKKKIEWGSQIRSYVFHPYKMIKDHRTDYEVGNVGPVMDGELDGFIKAYLMSEKENA